MKRMFTALLLGSIAYSANATVSAQTELVPWRGKGGIPSYNISPCGKYTFMWDPSRGSTTNRLTGYVRKTPDDSGLFMSSIGITIRAIPNGGIPTEEVLRSRKGDRTIGYVLYLPQDDYNEHLRLCAKRATNAG
jgi:hypothetical protein